MDSWAFFVYFSMVEKLTFDYLICVEGTTHIADQVLRHCRPPELANDSESRVAFSTSEAQKNQWIPICFWDYHLPSMDPTRFPANLLGAEVIQAWHLICFAFERT